MEFNDKKIFVGNLPFSANNSTLEKLFSQFGDIDGVKIVLDRATNKPKVGAMWLCGPCGHLPNSDMGPMLRPAAAVLDLSAMLRRQPLCALLSLDASQ